MQITVCFCISTQLYKTQGRVALHIVVPYNFSYLFVNRISRYPHKQTCFVHM